MLPSALRRSGLRPQRLHATATTTCPLDRRRCISVYGYTQSQALVYSKHGEPSDVLSLHKHSISPAHSDNLTLRFLASPINPADINQIQGTYPSKPTFDSSIGTATPSAVAGNEGVAEVVSVGSSVTSIQTGDWVIPRSPGLGTWRTYAQTPQSTILKLPSKTSLTPIQAATVSVNPTTAYRLLRDFASLPEGSWILQNGANSGVGRAVIQLARIWGLRTVNIVRDRPDISALKTDLLSLGATHVFTESDLLSQSFRSTLADATYSSPLPLALNCVGGKPAVALAKALSKNGIMVTYGAMAKQPLTLPPSLLIFKNIRFAGFWVSVWSAENPTAKEATVAELLDYMRAGELREGPTQELAWKETAVDEAALKSAVQGTLEGFRPGKGVFVFQE
ncbi:MAG: mitochondrial 2-enoyl thioester reductase [Piccolia ochrophora]|nr:MAG: mitochondrial 2-enoyl thioester reductase [Piccolia ochrophora]